HAQLIPAHELFDGMIFSAEESCVKPNPEIYRRLFERYSLKPEESFFVDDVAANIEGGEKLGMRGYRFYDGDVERLREVLLHASQYQAFANLKKEKD
ncbi:HAD family phosphatase, partial [Candidatus Falkowbacteria bacterium]|nr:HAD family phosphatase [Candidatus Falkowbacteria bacterium]